MRRIAAIVAVFAVLVFGGLTGGGLNTALLHGNHTVPAGDNGAGDGGG